MKSKSRKQNSKGCKNKKGKPRLSSKHEDCSSKKLRFVKEQEASGFLSSLGIRTGLDKLHIVCPLLF